MAAAEPLQNIKEEVTCSICRELFRDPVTSECGHSFCRECITRHCQGDGDVACPLCNEKLRKRHLRPNRELRNIVESLKSQTVEDPRGGNVCETHKKLLELYCKEDETPICMLCEKYKAHRGHTVVPVEEAVQEHWETLTKQLAGIESTYGRLHPLVSLDWKLLSPSAGEEALRKVKRLAENMATLWKVDTEGPRQRFEALASQSQPREPDRRGHGRGVATRSELRECQGGTMVVAAADSVKRIKAEVTCSICLELLRDPVTTECGHSFCERCISGLGKENGKMAEQLGVIESSCGKLHQFESEIWEHLPENEQDKEHESMKRVCEKLTTVFQVRTGIPERRAEDPASRTEPEESLSESNFPARDVSKETELEGHSGREPGSEPAAEKQEETGSHVGRVCEEAPTPKHELSQGGLDEAICNISGTAGYAEHKVDTKKTRKRPKDGSSLTPAEGSGGSRTDASSASSEEEGKGAPDGGQAQPAQLDPPELPLLQPLSQPLATAAAVAPATSTAPATATTPTTATAAPLLHQPQPQPQPTPSLQQQPPPSQLPQLHQRQPQPSPSHQRQPPSQLPQPRQRQPPLSRQLQPPSQLPQPRQRQPPLSRQLQPPSQLPQPRQRQPPSSCRSSDGRQKRSSKRGTAASSKEEER